MGKAVTFGFKFEAQLFVRTPSPPAAGFPWWRTFWPGDREPFYCSLLCTLQAKPFLFGKSLGLGNGHFTRGLLALEVDGGSARPVLGFNPVLSSGV